MCIKLLPTTCTKYTVHFPQYIHNVNSIAAKFVISLTIVIYIFSVKGANILNIWNKSTCQVKEMRISVNCQCVYTPNNTLDNCYKPYYCYILFAVKEFTFETSIADMTS